MAKQFKNIGGFIGNADKAKGGTVEYRLFRDESGVLFLQIHASLNPSGARAAGTHCELLISLVDVLEIIKRSGKRETISGYRLKGDEENAGYSYGEEDTCSNNDDKGFLRAALREINLLQASLAGIDLSNFK